MKTFEVRISQDASGEISLEFYDYATKQKCEFSYDELNISDEPGSPLWMAKRLINQVKKVFREET